MKTAPFTYLELATAEAVEDVASSILLAAGDAMTRHGNDPQGAQIVAAGFALALQRIGENIDANVPRVVREMLPA